MTIWLPIQLKTVDEVQTHVFGGRAHLSIVSKKTNAHFTYRIVQFKYQFLYAVWVRVNTKYMYLGTWNNKERKFIWNANKGIPREWKRYKAFLWVMGFVFNNIMPSDVFIYRDERCRACGKRLTNPQSIKFGIGPECIKRR